MSKKLKTGLIIGGILVFLALVGMLSGGENTNMNTNTSENNSQQEEVTDYSNTLTYSKLVDTTLDGISEYLDLEPTVDEYTPPTVSTAEWENDIYEVYSEYNKGEEVIYGGIITAKVYTCDDSGIDEDDVGRMLDFVNINDVAVSDFSEITDGEETYYQVRDIEDYKSITVRCDGEYVYINPLTNQYWNWVMEY